MQFHTWDNIPAVTPTLSNGQFTAGRVYPVTRPPFVGPLGQVFNDHGHVRFISLGNVGGRCAQLKPGYWGDDGRDWRDAGTWRACSPYPRPVEPLR